MQAESGGEVTPGAKDFRIGKERQAGPLQSPVFSEPSPNSLQVYIYTS